jgi:hypothetical protein
VRRPCRVTERDVDLRRVRHIVGLPAGDRLRKAELENGASIADSSAARNAGPSKVGRFVGLVRVHRLALHELALDREDRRKLVVPRLKRAHVLVDAEQRSRKSSTCGATRSGAPTPPSGRATPAPSRAAARRADSAASAAGQMLDESGVDARGALDRVRGRGT